MSSQNFNLRGLEPELMLILKKEANNQNISVNRLVLMLIERGVGYSRQLKKAKYHDLDKFAGTWSEKEAKEFEKNTEPFEKIDEDLWS